MNQSYRRVAFCAAVAVLLVVLLTPTSAHAQCPAPTLSVSAPDAAGNVAIHAQANGTCNGSSISLALNDGVFYSNDCTFPFHGGYGPTCTIDTTISIACLKNGQNTLVASSSCWTGSPESCSGPSSSSTSQSLTGHGVDGGISYAGPDDLGHGTVTINYDFGQYRNDGWIDFYDNGALVQSFCCGVFGTQTGTVRVGHNFTCDSVTHHQLLARIMTCGGYFYGAYQTDPSLTKDVTTSVSINPSTTITVTYDESDNTITIDDHFGNTETGANESRAIFYSVNGGPSYELGYPLCTQDISNHCHVLMPVDLTCVNGTVTWDARGCQKSDAMYNGPYTMPITHSAPTIRHTVARSPDGSSDHVDISYTFPSAGGTMTLTRLPTPDDPGATSVYADLPAQGVIPYDYIGTYDTTLRAEARQGCKYARDTIGLQGCCNHGAPPTEAPHPVRLWDGAVTYDEHDPLPDDLSRLFTRRYISRMPASHAFGVGWRSAFDATIITMTSSTPNSAVVYTEDDQHAVFDQIGAGWLQVWPSGVDAYGTLTGSDSSGYIYREAGSSMVRYYGGSGNHHLTGLKDLRSGRQIAITYDSFGAPATIVDSFGAWSATLTTDGNHRVTQIAIDSHPELVWNYAYDGNGNLTTVTPVNATAPWRSYSYVAFGSGWLLSTVTDALGNLIEQHTYDGNGRAITSTGPSGDITNIQYNVSPPTTVLTRADGSVSTYEQSFADRDVTTHLDGGCASCGGHDLTAAYGSSGHVWRAQDGRGYITEFIYDLTPYTRQNLLSERRALRPSTCDPATDSAHCAMTSAALAAATLTTTSATRTTSYRYDDGNWPERPTEIDTDSAFVPGQSTIETFTLDGATGQTLTHTTTGFTGSPAQQESHTTTTVLYDGAAAAAFDPGGTFQSSWLTLAQPAGIVKSVRGPRTDVDDTMLYVYYPIGSGAPGTAKGRLAAVKNALGHITHFDEYDVFGHATKITDPNGVVTTRAYDALGRLTTSTVKAVTGCDTSADPLCATDLTTTNLYANTSGPLSYSLGANRSATAYTYDNRGRVATVGRGSADCSGCPQPNVTTTEQIAYTYDAATQKKASESYQELVNSTWTERRRESYTYDSNGRLARITHADATSIVYGYDGADDLTSVQDERHTTPNTLYAFDPAKRLSTVTQTLGTGSVVTSYGYDIRDDLTAVTDPNGNSTSYVFDDFGRMLRQTSPVTGVTTYGYDPSGNLLSTTDANSATTTRAYDALGRVLSAASSGGSGAAESVSWTYDATTLFGIGRLASMVDPAGSTTYAYDRRGLLLSEIRTDGQTFTTSYQYDAEGNRTVMTYPSGLTAQYGFDFSNHMTSVSAAGVAVVLRPPTYRSVR